MEKYCKKESQPLRLLYHLYYFNVSYCFLFFENLTNIVRDDMAETITRDSRVSIAAACFSMYAYNELKKQLEDIDELRFIFTSPTFVAEKEAKQKREFYIPKAARHFCRHWQFG